MQLLLQNDLVLFILKAYGILFVLGPIVLRATFKFTAKLNPQPVQKESLPPDVQQFIAPRAAAHTYWAADAIRNQYLKNPGPLVQA